MKANHPPKDAIHPVSFHEDTLWLTSSKTLRKTIGVLGMALPLLLIAGLYVFADFAGPLRLTHGLSVYSTSFCA